MIDTIFSLITAYGVYIIFACSFLSCLALPIPTSLMMLSGGAFVATGDLVLWQVIAAAYAGAVIGDQAGYLIGRYGGAPLVERLAQGSTRAVALSRARGMVDRHGGLGVFFSTWLIAPLGPWVNFIAGTTGLSWMRFTIWDASGEMIWVLIYVGLGFAFASQVGTVAEIAGNVIGLIVAITLVLAMVIWIRSALRNHKAVS